MAYHTRVFKGVTSGSSENYLALERALPLRTPALCCTPSRFDGPQGVSGCSAAPEEFAPTAFLVRLLLFLRFPACVCMSRFALCHWDHTLGSMLWTELRRRLTGGVQQRRNCLAMAPCAQCDTQPEFCLTTQHLLRWGVGRGGSTSPPPSPHLGPGFHRGKKLKFTKGNVD